MTEHTPGPWIASKTVSGSKLPARDIIMGADGNGNVIMESPIADCGISTEQSKANARLIAAAPDLLRACMAMLATFHDHPDRDEASLNLARQAIARATSK